MFSRKELLSFLFAFCPRNLSSSKLIEGCVRRWHFLLPYLKASRLTFSCPFLCLANAANTLWAEALNRKNLWWRKVRRMEKWIPMKKKQTPERKGLSQRQFLCILCWISKKNCWIESKKNMKWLFVLFFSNLFSWNFGVSVDTSQVMLENDDVIIDRDCIPEEETEQRKRKSELWKHCSLCFRYEIHLKNCLRSIDESTAKRLRHEIETSDSKFWKRCHILSFCSTERMPYQVTFLSQNNSNFRWKCPEVTAVCRVVSFWQWFLVSNRSLCESLAYFRVLLAPCVSETIVIVVFQTKQQCIPKLTIRSCF